MNLKVWLTSLKYLPSFMRDFHDQKDLFKTVDQAYVPPPEPYRVDWVKAQVYTIDRFLWFMGQHGYTLQRNRTKAVEFKDIRHTLDTARKERQQKSTEVLKSAFSTRSSQGG